VYPVGAFGVLIVSVLSFSTGERRKAADAVPRDGARGLEAGADILRSTSNVPKGLAVTNSLSFTRALARSPVLWGGAACALFYGLIHANVLQGEFVDRYFLSHPVEYVATAMFFIGLALLAVKMVELIGQFSLVGRPLLGPPPPNGERPAGCDVLLTRLEELPAGRQNDYLIRRLRELLKFVRSRGSAEDLDEQMQALADVDVERSDESYALCTLLAAMIPMLGFLGTVIGITRALGHLAPDQLEQSLPTVMAGLYVAFDTTALALGLTIGLMFVRFFVGRVERNLLEQVDRHVAVEMEDRFVTSSNRDEGRDEIRQLAQRVFEMTDRVVDRQAQLWHQSMDAAGRRWTQLTQSAGEQIRASLEGALAGSLRAHAKEITAAEQTVAEQNRQHWNEVQKAQVQTTHALASLQASLTHQAEILERAVTAAGEVTSLEDALNRNLDQLRGAKHFEQTAVSLAAAVQLLAARLGDDNPYTPIHLTDQPPEQQAA